MVHIRTMDPCFASQVLEAKSGVRQTTLPPTVSDGIGKSDYDGCFVAKQPQVKEMAFFAELEYSFSILQNKRFAFTWFSHVAIGNRLTYG